MLDADRLVVLATVEDRGGISAAAAVLHVTPSAVSQQLRLLERSAGTPLLTKVGREVRLTVAGRRLAASGRRIAHELQVATDVAADWSGAASRAVRIASFQTAIRRLLVPLLRRPDADAPGLHIVEMARGGALREIGAGALDLAMVEHLGDTDEDVEFGPHVATLLTISDPFRVVVPVGWTIDDSSVRTSLAQRRWVGHAPGTAGAAMLTDLEQAWDMTADVAHVCTAYVSAVALVAAGAGAAVAPELALPAPGTPDAARVRVVAHAPDLAVRRIRVVGYRAGRIRPAVVDLLDDLQAQARAAGLQVSRP